MLDGEATDSGLIEDEATAKTSVNSENGEQVLFYEPDLNGFAYTTEIIYYNSDNISDDDVKIISIKEYIDNGKKFSIKDNNKTYIFADYSNYTQSHLGKTTTKKPIWANIRTTSNGLKANWVWIPRYAYKLEGGKTNIILIDSNNNPINTEKFGNTLPEGYTVHEAFVQDTDIRGMWFSKYNPSEKN